MQRKHLFILSLLVVVPLLVFMLLGRRLVQHEQERTRRQFEDLLQANLHGVDRSITAYFSKLEQDLLLQEVDPSNPEETRSLMRTEPLFEQIFVLDQDGTLIYPDPGGPLSNRETSYLMKIEQLIDDRNLIRQRQDQLPDPAPKSISQKGSNTNNFGFIGSNDRIAIAGSKLNNVFSNASNLGIVPRQDHGWYTWYWGKGIQLIHWRGIDDGRVLAVGLQRARWMADVISILPDSNPEDEKSSTAPAQIRLIDAEGRAIYLWGAKQDVAADAEPLASVHLSAPLRPWQLQHFGPSNPLSADKSATLINLLAAGSLLAAGLLGLAAYLSREIGRQTREAQQRVSFVNQVSHELKTPLTNIRLYADMLEQDLLRIDPNDDDRAKAHLSVITGESNRLGRLINNVLTFARLDRDTKQSRPQPGSVDQVIAHVVGQFRPSLEQRQIAVTLNLDAGQEVFLDVDALEQMLGNLISNVEKYAADGKHLRISSQYQKDLTVIDISDAGPGISTDFAKRIFKPFERASDHIEAATGTGIGLAIARGLARRHAGDLVLLESAIGASFRLTIHTPSCDDREET